MTAHPALSELRTGILGASELQRGRRYCDASAASCGELAEIGVQGAKPVEPRRAGRVDMFGGVACVVEAMAAAGTANPIKMWGHTLLATLK